MFLSGACNVQVFREEILLKNECKKDPNYVHSNKAGSTPQQEPELQKYFNLIKTKNKYSDAYMQQVFKLFNIFL